MCEEEFGMKERRKKQGQCDENVCDAKRNSRPRHYVREVSELLQCGLRCPACQKLYIVDFEQTLMGIHRATTVPDIDIVHWFCDYL